MTADTVSRRSVLKQLALAATAAGGGVFNLDAARVVHAMAGEARTQPGGYVPQALTGGEYATVVRLAELIVPADEGGGSGVDAGAPEFIDLLCSQNDELADIYQGGVAWCDATMRRHVGVRFVDASSEQQVALLDALVAAERGGRRAGDEGLEFGDLRHGVRFFDWIRRMTVDAYYTSPIGIADLQYRGNEVLDRYVVPADAMAFINRRIEEM